MKLSNRRRGKTHRFFSIAVIFVFLAIPLFPADLLSEAEAKFLANEPRQAVVLMEAALKEYPGNEKIYLYLGVIYHQLGDTKKAVAILEEGLPYAVTRRDMFLFDLGSFYFLQGEMGKAEQSFSAAIKTNPSLTSAYLNRANSRMELEMYRDALADYTYYLTAEPGTSQRSEIEAMIAALQGYLSEEEARRLAEDQRKKEEEARQRALLESVLDSLLNASGDTTNLAADTEDIADVDVETDIDD